MYLVYVDDIGYYGTYPTLAEAEQATFDNWWRKPEIVVLDENRPSC